MYQKNRLLSSNRTYFSCFSNCNISSCIIFMINYLMNLMNLMNIISIKDIYIYILILKYRI